MYDDDEGFFSDGPHELPPFESHEELMRYVLENVVKPKLEEMGTSPGEGFDQADVNIEPFIISSDTTEENAPDISGLMETIQNGLAEGLSLEYVLEEMTDLPIRQHMRDELDGMAVSLVQVGGQDPDAVKPIDAEALQRLFDSSQGDEDGGTAANPESDRPSDD